MSRQGLHEDVAAEILGMKPAGVVENRRVQLHFGSGRFMVGQNVARLLVLHCSQSLCLWQKNACIAREFGCLAFLFTESRRTVRQSFTLRHRTHKFIEPFNRLRGFWGQNRERERERGSGSGRGSGRQRQRQRQRQRHPPRTGGGGGEPQFTPTLPDLQLWWEPSCRCQTGSCIRRLLSEDSTEF